MNGNLVQNWMTSIVQTCWVCDSVNKLGSLGLSIADQCFTMLSGQIATLLGLAMALWLLLFAARIFLPFGPDGSNSSLWNQGAKKLFHFALLLAMLQSSEAFWDYVFTPIFSTGIGLASTILALGDGSQTCAAPDSSGSGLAGAQSVMQQLDCPLTGVQSQFAEGMAIGVATMAAPPSCSMSSSLSLLAPFAGSIAWILQILAGLIILIIYFFGYILFPILLMDVVMRTIFLAIIAPLAIAASLFQTTHHMAQKAGWGLVQSALTLVFAAIVATLGKAAIVALFSGLSSNPGTAITDWPSLSQALADPCQSGLTLGFTDLAFYKLAGLGLILLFMMRKCGSLAAELCGGSAGDHTGAQAGVASIAGRLGYGLGTIADQMMGGRGGASLPSHSAHRALIQDVSGDPGFDDDAA